MPIQEKVLKLQKEVAQFRKDKQNPHFKYGYASATGVNDVIKDKLVELEILAQLQVEHTGTMGNVLIATATLSLIDPSDGTFMEFQSIGSGTDSGDKHAMKAATAAQKYASIAAVFGASNDDPEADAAVDKPAPKLVAAKDKEPESAQGVDTQAVTINEAEAATRTGRQPFKVNTDQGIFQSFDSKLTDKVKAGATVVFRKTKYGNDIVEVL